jgi:hypothetical protein
MLFTGEKKPKLWIDAFPGICAQEFVLAIQGCSGKTG